MTPSWWSEHRECGAADERDLRSRSAVVAASRLVGVAVGRPPGLLHLGRGGPTGPTGYHGPLRRRATWRAALPSSDDGQGVALRLLRRVGAPPRIAQRLREDFAFRVLAANNRPAPYQVRGDVTSAPYRTFAQNRPRRKVRSIPGRQPIKPSATSPTPSPASCRDGRSGLPAVLSLPGGGGP